jgi:hypothetical protein
MATADQIAAIYQKELGRAPDPSGLQFYQNLANQGTDLGEIARQISGSSEGMTFDPSGNISYSSTAATQPNATAQFDLESYLNKVNDMYTQAAQASAASNMQNAQQAVAANRVNQVTPFGNVQYTQSGTDAQGNPIWTATQTLPQGLQGAYQGILGQVSNQYGQAFNPQLPSVGINPGETYEAAIMRRLEPTQERQRKSLEVDLANQGIMPGSEAYNRAKTQLAQAQNDQLTSAVVGGFQTGLAANQNAFNQGLTSYQLPMATLNQLRTGAQPSYVSPSQQATTAGPDYLGAYTAQQNYNLGLQNAQAASNAGLTSGLFGLGSAALLNPTGVSQAYDTISSGLSKLNPFA